MRYQIITLFALFIAGLFVSCEKNETVIPSSQKILFEYYYVNYAWGYSHYGFFIDNEGRILDYSQQGGYNDNDWNFPDDQGSISEQALMENLQKTTIRDTSIDKETLKKYSDRIYLVKDDDYTEYQNMYDYGSLACVCYQYDENTKIYKRILLSEDGDWVRINKNKYAAQISDWLKSIHIRNVYYED